MKKTLIASAASMALAALPMVGVFADEPTPASNPQPVYDQLTVNVNGVCTFSRTTGTGSYEQTMAANALNSNFGTSTFTSGCNNGTGYTVTLSTSSLVHSTGAGTAIAYAQAAEQGAAPTDPTAGSGTWVAYRSAGTGAAVASGYTSPANIGSGETAFATTGADGTPASTFTVVYKVATNAVQAQGSYSGTLNTNAGAAGYTLAQNS